MAKMKGSPGHQKFDGTENMRTKVKVHKSGK